MADTIRLVRKNSKATRISMGDYPSIDLTSVDEVDVHPRVAEHLADGEEFVVQDSTGNIFSTVAAMRAASTE